MPPSRRRPSGRATRRASAARSSAAPSSRSSSAVDDLALLMTLEMGKPLAESKAEIAYAAEFFRWFAEEARAHRRPLRGATRRAGPLLTMRQPVGPCLMITPWNFPMAMGTRKIGPAIAAGCTMVVKPAQQTPLVDAARWPRSSRRPGLPGGVLNVFTASSSGVDDGPLIEDPRLRKLTFTGSTEVGQRLIEQSAERRAQGLDGARRQRPVPGVRRRRRRRRRRGRDDRQDAQRRRGLHLGQPLPRGRPHRRRVHREAGEAHRRDEGRPRHRGRRQGRPADRRRPAPARSRPSSWTTRRAGRRGRGRRPIPDGTGYFYTRPCSAASRTTPSSCARRSSARSPR